MVIFKTEKWSQLGMNYTYNDSTESTAIVKLEQIMQSLFLLLI